jgi:hypothetical protein|tara:strand:+ start:554 stop:709 length:156 start_codon:yes stop_codon:yes gene_type:complete
MNNKVRKFTHYALMTWAVALGSLAIIGIAFMMFTVITEPNLTLDIACGICD